MGKIALLIGLVGSQTHFFQKCGEYTLGGVLECRTASQCDLVLAPKSQSEYHFKLKEPLRSIVLYRDKSITAQVKINQVKNQLLGTMDESTIRRSLPNLSVSAMKLNREDKCKN
jgi:hypothetical protein